MLKMEMQLLHSESISTCFDIFPIKNSIYATDSQ